MIHGGYTSTNTPRDNVMKSAIVYLTRSSAGEVAQMARSIELLESNFLPWSPADIFVFHEPDFDKQMLSAHDVFERNNVTLARVDFSSIPPGTEHLDRGQRGYRHMCHFFANDIFLRSELLSYDYYMRLDVDSYILSKVRFNVFESMQSRNIKYAYRMVMTENSNVATGLAETAKAFFGQNPALAMAYPHIRKVRLYYTNFEICKLDFFRSEAWQSYFAAIDSAGGIWHTRWGDAPIRWIGLQYLLKKDEIWFFRDMTYFHRFILRKGLGFRMPLEYARSVMSTLIEVLKMKHAKKNGLKCAAAR